MSTRRLQRYLDWFLWERSVRADLGDRAELMGRFVGEGRYAATWRRVSAEPYAFWDYWEAKLASVSK